MRHRTAIGIASFLLALAVGLGAFGAHALENVLTQERIQTWETAVFYHTWNALGVILIALASHLFEIQSKWSIRFLFAGILFFSGSLYVLCLTDVGVFGAITPIGGVLFITGWIVFGWNCVRQASQN